LPYLDAWEDSVKKCEGEFEDSHRKRMLLSTETLVGIRMVFHVIITIMLSSFICHIGQVSLQTSWCEGLLSQKICQDPLEKFFGCQRQRGGTNENPSVAEFCKNTQSLRVVSNFCRPSVHGNCRGNKSHDLIDEEENAPLPKRRCVRKKNI